ncbi:unnamed protein product, partial [Sphacelaria rigidula]
WLGLDLTTEQLSRTTGATGIEPNNAPNINILELAGMVFTAWVVLVIAGDRTLDENDPVHFLGDNTGAIRWINRCGGTTVTRAAALMLILGLLEIKGGWCHQAHYIAGADNVIADGISR